MHIGAPNVAAYAASMATYVAAASARSRCPSPMAQRSSSPSWPFAGSSVGTVAAQSASGANEPTIGGGPGGGAGVVTRASERLAASEPRSSSMVAVRIGSGEGSAASVPWELLRSEGRRGRAISRRTGNGDAPDAGGRDRDGTERSRTPSKQARQWVRRAVTRDIAGYGAAGQDELRRLGNKVGSRTTITRSPALG